MTTTKQGELAETNASQSGDQTSLSLIARATGKDQVAWERLVKLYSPMVYFWCQQSGLPQADLNDVFQEVFHTLARKIDKFRPIENGTFRGWLRTLTRNKLNDHFRKNGREAKPQGGTEALQRLEQIPAADRFALADRDSEPRLESKDRESEIQHSMLCQAMENVRERIAEQTWKAFWMVVIDGRETSDVAQDLSMRPGTVRVAKSRVLKQLRLEIGDSIE